MVASAASVMLRKAFCWATGLLEKMAPSPPGNCTVGTPAPLITNVLFVKPVVFTGVRLLRSSVPPLTVRVPLVVVFAPRDEAAADVLVTTRAPPLTNVGP